MISFLAGKSKVEAVASSLRSVLLFSDLRESCMFPFSDNHMIHMVSTFYGLSSLVAQNSMPELKKEREACEACKPFKTPVITIILG